MDLLVSHYMELPFSGVYDEGGVKEEGSLRHLSPTYIMQLLLHTTFCIHILCYTTCNTVANNLIMDYNN